MLPEMKVGMHFCIHRYFMHFPNGCSSRPLMVYMSPSFQSVDNKSPVIRRYCTNRCVIVAGCWLVVYFCIYMWLKSGFPSSVPKASYHCPCLECVARHDWKRQRRKQMKTILTFIGYDVIVTVKILCEKPGYSDIHLFNVCDLGRNKFI